MREKNFSGRKSMNKVYIGRILGLSIVMSLVGILGFVVLKENVFYVILFFSLIWLMNYDFNRYEAKFGHERGEED